MLCFRRQIAEMPRFCAETGQISWKSHGCCAIASAIARKYFFIRLSIPINGCLISHVYAESDNQMWSCLRPITPGVEIPFEPCMDLGFFGLILLTSARSNEASLRSPEGSCFAVLFCPENLFKSMTYLTNLPLKVLAFLCRKRYNKLLYKGGI